MFQKSPDNGYDADMFGLSGDSGQQAANAADDERNFHPALSCLIKPIYHLFIRERIHLGDNTGGFSGLGRFYLFVYTLQESLFQSLGSNQ